MLPRLLYMPRPGRPWQAKEQGLRRTGFEVATYIADPRVPHAYPPPLKALLASFQPQILFGEYGVFCVSRGPCSWRAIPAIKRDFPRVKIVLWSEEVRNRYTGPPQGVAVHLSRLYLNHADAGQARLWMNVGAKPPIGTIWGSADPAIWRSDGVQPHYDVAFMGSNYGNMPLSGFRLGLLRYLMPRFRVLLVGKGWPKDLGARPQINNERALAVEVAQAKVLLNVNHYDLARYYPERIFQYMALGRPIVSHRVRGMARDLGGVVHEFGTPEEARDRIYRLLTGDRWRSAGAATRAGFQGWHTWRSHYWALRRLT